MRVLCCEIISLFVVELKVSDHTFVHELGISKALIDALVRKLCMKILKFIGLIPALQTKLVHTLLVFSVCNDICAISVCYPV